MQNPSRLSVEKLESRVLMASDLGIPLEARFCPALFESDSAVEGVMARDSLDGEAAMEKIAKGEDASFVLYGPGDAPKIDSIVFGDGSNQRSIIKNIVVLFDSVVNIASGAFTLEKRNSGNWVSVSSELSLSVSAVAVNGVTVATITFSGSGAEANSLPDGNYRLTAVASAITKDGVQLDGDGNGSAGDSFVRGEVPADRFFRQYGDFDGNRVVDSTDVDQFKLGNGTSVGEAAYQARLDFNGDGLVNGFDIGRIRLQNGKTLVF